ncbi:MAG TPA: NAD(P)/FAD-dependent oxidoreductase [Enteractinococcus helveticum]|uniref:NAD(P)/FAD-dependent oxidoreductase n=1 Tax=Enteractinococcus helveticum TaxID=1837282 RepID=A0A921FL89_9MICC|nr:NAD(P)/FAD-dependent oxidoreductase [Enteractinococcus helveticum]HJF13362.1 NAD(P)/FAD-dependent oxidoreductase [Enteractinococcus helveticum]
MKTQHVNTVIIGAGQAGLSAAYHLQRRGVECLVLEGSARIGDQWRDRYDSLRLFTPAYADRLDGLDFPGDKEAFPTKDEMADYLELYALTHDLPVRLHSQVRRLSAGTHGGYLVELEREGQRELISCDAVIIATGTFGQDPKTPDFANELAESIFQLHSIGYHHPSDLPDGPVLVVGASHSGLDLALELGTDRKTTLVGPARGNIPFEWGSRVMRRAFPLIEFVFQHVLTRRTPIGRKVFNNLRHHGSPQLRVKEHHLKERGVEWLQEHIVGVSADGLPQLANGRTFDVTSIVWATGLAHDYSWIDLPLPIEHGWPVEYRGVVEELPGLYFLGLAFQYAFSSGEMSGVGRDAAYLANRIIQDNKAHVLAA